MYLEKINSPADLKSLSLTELSVLAGEIRECIVSTVSRTGGHLASSLGAVELTVSLHYCLNTPRDVIIWDVGHQSYAHKLLTGRRDYFPHLRQYGGPSGFPCRDESPFDAFTTGHSSTAVSLALGLVCARDHASKAGQHFKVVAVIGDGSLSGGLCFEGLNNAGHLQKDILVILNTNELSIAPNVGALSTYLNKLISLPIYNRFKDSLEHFAKSRLPKGSRLIKLANKFEEGLKGLFIPGIFFEELGFRYFGPIDGHNLNILVPTLKNILNIKGPRVLHVVTKKGKGYSPAEKEPVRFHSIGPFKIETGADADKKATGPTYTEVFSRKLVELAKTNPKIVAITAAMPEGTGLDKFRDAYPQRFFDVGIAEEHALCFASGFAHQGLKPVVAIYSTFLQRAYDQIIEEVALQNLTVVLAVDRAGIVGEDGVTHQGIFDISYLRTIPNLVIMAPKDGAELEAMLEFAVGLDRPVAIRYPKDKIPNSEFRTHSTSLSVRPELVEGRIPNSKIQLGKAQILHSGKDAVIIAVGSMVLPSLAAAEMLEKDDIETTVINSRFIKPLDVELLREASAQAGCIVTVEEGIAECGFGSAVSEVLQRPVVRIGLPCEFIVHGRRDILLEKYGLTKEGIARTVLEEIKRQGKKVRETIP